MLLAISWVGWPSSFANDLDAAVVWNNGKAYFFKGTNYISYDIASDRVDPGYPKETDMYWPGLNFE